MPRDSADDADFEAEAAGEIASSPASVLVVDDDSRNLLALREVLGDIADVVCASSGEEALRHLLKQQFAVIILDVLMPVMDGYETAQLIRARAQTRDTPIIFLTAINKEDAHLLKGYDSGAVDYVFKPLEPLIIRSKVSVFVSLYEKTREIEQKAAEQERLLQERLQAEQERMRVLEALRASEEREAILLRALPLALYLRDNEQADPRFVSGNVAAITGFDVQDFLRDPGLWRERMHPEDVSSFDQPWTGEERNHEFRWRHADGHYRHLLAQAVRLAARGGIIAGTLRDVSAERRLQEQLQQSQKMDALGKLTGGIAHDFNNLLAAVLSGISLIERRTPLDDRSRQIMEMTRHAVGQGKQLIDRMLAFSRRQSLSPQVVDLEETRRTLDSLLSPILGGLISLEWQIGEGLWPVFVDPAQLELSVMNLVLNARDAMPGGGTVTLSLENRRLDAARGQLAAGDYVVIAVADTGEGIAPELLGKVMEPFFTTKEVGKGTGLGLSTAYGFTRQSGGTLEIESSPNVGTRVEIWLPRSELALENAEIDERKGPEGLPVNGLRVLLVDDSDSLRRFTEEHLADLGFNVTTAEGGAEARAVIEGAPAAHDVIVTDYAMPGTSGLDLIRFARKRRADFPAVIITGYADTGAMAECPPDVPVVSKPFAVPRLAEAIISVARR